MLTTASRLARKAQKCYGVDDIEESTACLRTGSKRSLPLGHRTGQKSDPNGTLSCALFASQSFGKVPRPTLHVCLCGQVRPVLLFVFTINTNLSHRQWADRDCGLTGERLRGRSATLSRLPHGAAPGLPPLLGCSPQPWVPQGC